MNSSGGTSSFFLLSLFSLTIGGIVSGLKGSIALQNNAEDNITLNTDGNFAFPTNTSIGNPYSVSIQSKPSGQFCGLKNGVGTAISNVTNISVNCFDAFTRQMGVSGTGYTEGFGITADFKGNVYVTGMTDGGLDGNTLTGTYDLFLTKYDGNGIKLWTKQLGVASQNVFGYGVTTDITGNVYIVGFTNGGLNGNTLTGNQDVFVIKYDENGVRLWTRQMGVATSNTKGYAITTDSSGGIYVTGYTNGGLDGNTLTGTNDLFIIKYDGSGNKLWTKQLGASTKDTYGYGITTDPTGGIYVTGYTFGGLDGNTLAGTYDLFITKYDASGTRIWTKQKGVTSKLTSGRAITSDPYGGVYVTGTTSAGLDGNTLTGTTDVFVAKYDTNGNWLWTKQMGSTTVATGAFGIAADSVDGIYTTGYTYGGLGGNTLTGSQDVFVIKYNVNGTKVFTKQMGVSGKNTSSDAIATDSFGNIYVTGVTDGGLDGNTLTGTGGDVFITNKLRD